MWSGSIFTNVLRLKLWKLEFKQQCILLWKCNVLKIDICSTDAITLFQSKCSISLEFQIGLFKSKSQIYTSDVSDYGLKSLGIFVTHSCLFATGSAHTFHVQLEGRYISVRCFCFPWVYKTVGYCLIMSVCFLWPLSIQLNYLVNDKTIHRTSARNCCCVIVALFKA